MDPISVLILAAIYAAVRGNREARRAVGRDYRGRRDRWSSRAEPWMTPRGRARGRGGRRVAGYDRTGRAFTRDQAAERRTGDPGWRTDPRAWRGREGRARVARGIRPSAVRAGIITGAMAYTAVFGASVAARGFATGARGGYRLGKAHYRAKRNQAQDPTFTVTPGQPGESVDPNSEIIDAVIVEDANTPYEGPRAADPSGRRRERAKPGYVTVLEPEPGAAPVGRWVVTTAKQAYNKEIYRIVVEDADLEEVMARRVPDGMYRTIRPLPANDPGRGAAGWRISRYTSLDAWMLNEEPAEYITVTDPVEFDRHLDELMRTGQIFDVRGMADYEVERERERTRSQQEPAPREAPAATDAQPADSKNGPWLLTVHGPGANRFHSRYTEGIAVYDAAELDRRLAVVAAIPGLSADVTPLPEQFQDSRLQTAAGPTAHPGDDSLSEITTTRPTPSPAGITGQYVPVGGASISAPVLMEGANFDAHLHNLEVIAKEARSEYSSAELTLASASAARQRAQHAMTAVEQMAVGLAAQDFGETHVGNMASLHELLARHVGQAQAAERAAQESLATSEQLIEMCTGAAAVFRRDHGQLAEAHANAPHAAKTREAYQPM